MSASEFEYRIAMSFTAFYLVLIFLFSLVGMQTAEAQSIEDVNIFTGFKSFIQSESFTFAENPIISTMVYIFLISPLIVWGSMLALNFGTNR